MLGFKQRSDLVTYSFIQQPILIGHLLCVRTILVPEYTVMNKTDVVPALAEPIFQERKLLM